ncbi:MAG: hypothetical protein M1816_003106 [Peltula sp. TS41687]|nr:MAG: hypothetical protein M1816_003106 [Peltula sp. TS41687]
MAVPTPDKRVVYLHCRPIFSGAHAELRRQKKIRQLLTKKKASISTLTHEFSIDVICIIAKELLEDGVFGSETKARLRFPELFKTSEAQLAERQASEVLAARSEAEAIEELIAASENDEDIASTKDKDGKPPEAEQNEEHIIGVGEQRPIASTIVHALGSGPAVPSLHPMYLPYRTQHLILNTTQAVVEECCFEFGKRCLPQVITTEGWEGPESGELTKWTKYLKKEVKKSPELVLCEIAGSDWRQALSGCNQLRHTAVHRLRTTAKGILSLLESALTLTKALNDTDRSSRIRTIIDELGSSIDDVTRNKHLLENKLLDELQVLAKRRAELDQLERVAVENMVKTDRDHLAVVGSLLEDLVIRLGRESNEPSCDLHGSASGADKSSSEVEDNEICSEGLLVVEGSPTMPVENHLDAKGFSLEEASLAQEDVTSGDPTVTGKLAPSEDIASVRAATLSKETTVTAEAVPMEACTLADEVAPMVEPSLMDDVIPANDIAMVVETAMIQEPPLSEEAALAAEIYPGDKADFSDQSPTSDEVPAEAHDEGVSNSVEVAHRPEEATPLEESSPLRGVSVEGPLPIMTQSERIAEQRKCFLAEQSVRGNKRPKNGKEKKQMAKQLSRDLLAIQGTKAYGSSRAFRDAIIGKESAAIHALSSLDEDNRKDESSSKTSTVSVKLVYGLEIFRTLLVLPEMTRGAISRQSQAYLESKILQEVKAERTWQHTLRSIVLDGHEVDLSNYDVEDLTFLLSTIGNSGIPELTVEINVVTG